MNHLNVDIETFSSVDINKAGLYKYAQADDFQVLLFGYSLNGAPVQVIDLFAGESISGEIMAALFAPTCIKHAYNATFEWYCLSRHFQINKNHFITMSDWLKQWRCIQLHGLYCGYPAGLKNVGSTLQLPQDKRKSATGDALIRTFCVPCKPTARNGNRTRTLPKHEPEKWQLFKQYNIQDVITEMEIEHRLSPYPVPDDVQQQWVTDQIINACGVAADINMINGAIWCADTINDRLMQEAIDLSGLNNPKSIKQLSDWLETELDEEITDLRKDTVTNLLGGDLNSDKARRMLEIRQLLGKTSVSKYIAMSKAACIDNRLRGMLRFYKANRTGRWAGQIVQPQNLPQTHVDPLPLARELVKKHDIEMLQYIYGDIPNTLSQLIRTALIAPEGHVLLDADFSAIEARVIAWLAGEEWVLEVFRTHGKIYEACASQMFGVPIDKITKGNPEYALRQKGKVATLALGYQGSSGALINMGALKQGLTEEELPDIVHRWRQANRRIVDLWYAVERAAVEVIKTGRPTGVNGLLFALEGDDSGQFFMTITLPSGRKLFYVRPFIAPNEKGRDSIHYWGQQQGKKGSGAWNELETYGGKLVENCVQAIARDCLAVNIERLAAAGYQVVFHVHDEVVIEVAPSNSDLNNVCYIMGQPIEWAPGLPLKADGWTDVFYKKD